MHNVPLEIWSAAMRGATLPGEKIIASDRNLRWQRTVGVVAGNAATPTAFFADQLVSYLQNDSRVFQWPP
jgi:hypothetical protein